jgi:3-isopropylmalate dehydratase small subunit
VNEGDEIEIDITSGKIHHRDATYTFPKFPDSMRQLLELGGLAEYLKATLHEKS